MKSKFKPVFNFIFGPVPSMRLGASLGVDLIPHKICSTEPWVQPMTQEVFKRIQACMHNVRVVDDAKHAALMDEFSGDLKGIILSTVKRRPCMAEDISKITGADENNINQHLDILLKNGEVVKKKMPRGTFFSLKQ